VATLGGGQAQNTTASAPSSGTGPSQGVSSASNPNPIVQMQATYDTELTQVIDNLAGVNSAVVMVTLDSTNELSVANNVKKTTQTQTGGSGQSNSQSTTVDNSVFTEHTPDGSSVPFVTSQRSPTVRGVVVLVDAKDFFIAKAEIIDAIGHVLDVPAYKISVEPKRSNP
jgi:stage III sporulation protein AG